MALPKQPQSRAGMPPRRARVLLGAIHKVGKTTLLAEWAPDTTLIIDTQNGTNLLDGQHYVQHVQSWQEFVKTIDDICKGGHRFHTIGLDMVNDLWSFCDLYCGRTIDGTRVPASGLDDYGRSSHKARASFNAAVGRLLAAPVGIWFLTHLREKTDKEGQLLVYTPELDKAVYGRIVGAADFVWLAETQSNGQRVVHTQPTRHFEAGSRRPVPSPLPMDVRAIALAMDRALNPQDYDEQGKRKQPEPDVPDVVEAADPAPADPDPIERTGESDVPADVQQTLDQAEQAATESADDASRSIGESGAAEILLYADGHKIPRDKLAKAAEHAAPRPDARHESFEDDAYAIGVLAHFTPHGKERLIRWVGKSRAKQGEAS